MHCNCESDLWCVQDKDIDELDTCDIEDDEELYLAVDESNEYDGDDLCNLSADDNVEPVDNADDVISELESLFEVQHLYSVFLELLRRLRTHCLLFISQTKSG